MCLVLFDKLGKRFLTALLSLDYPGKFIAHVRSLYLSIRRIDVKVAASGQNPRFPADPGLIQASTPIAIPARRGTCPQLHQYTLAQGKKKAPDSGGLSFDHSFTSWTTFGTG
jgi:hypothetical protein